MDQAAKSNVIVIGAGPAGLSAAYRLTASGYKVQILEADPSYVGGLSKTICHANHKYDLGGHRFFTKSTEVEEFWRHLLGDEFQRVERSSSIMYNGQFYSYPLDLTDVFIKFGFFRSVRALFSLLIGRFKDPDRVVTFEDWIIRNFGRYLYTIFFKTYTEKVWGLKGNEISADWAAQRIKGVSIVSIVKAFFHRKRSAEHSPKSLITHFDYPRQGAGQMWEKLASIILERGGEIIKGKKVTRISYFSENKMFKVEGADQITNEFYSAPCHAIVSTMPLGELAVSFGPHVPQQVIHAAENLEHRDMLIVFLSVKNCEQLAEQWIYVHTPKLRVGRIQNLSAWSGDLLGEEGCYNYTLEYFVSHTESLWSKSDSYLADLAFHELKHIPGLEKATLAGSHVTRVRDAYPVYNSSYQDNIQVIRNFLKDFEPRLQLAGRNGLHRYNNQDHSVMTGFLAAQNIIEKWQCYDVWKVNQDAQYLEEGADSKSTPIHP